MAYSTRSSSKPSSEHGDTLSATEAEILKQKLDTKERLLREQSEAINKQAAELQEERNKHEQHSNRGLENLLLSFQTELQALRNIPGQISMLSSRIDSLQISDNQTSSPRETPYTTPEPTRSHTPDKPPVPPVKDYPMNPIRLKDISDTIPKYNGQNIPIFQFCKICERALTLIPLNQEPYLVQLILGKLFGHAYTAVEGTEYQSLQQLLRKLKLIFGPNKSLNQYKGELGNAYMRPNETVFDFASRIKELRTAIIDCEIAQNPLTNDWSQGINQEIDYANIERDILDSFVNGLPPELLVRLRLEGYSSFDDAFTKAVQLTKTLEIEAARRKNSFSPRPNSPGRQDTPSYNIRSHSNPLQVPSPPRSILQRPQGPLPFIKPLIPGQPGPNYPSPLTCRYCKSPGHIIANCEKLAARKTYLEHSGNFSQNQNQENISGNASRAPISSDVRRDTETAGRPHVQFQDQVKEITTGSSI